MKKVSGHIICDGSAVNVDCGFVPDKVMLIDDLNATNPIIHYFIKELTNTNNGYGQYGITDTAGTKTKCASAAAGFSTYDTVSVKVLVSSPTGSGELMADFPNTWTQARSTAATARSSTALGTLIKPTSGNETGYIYECTTEGTGGSSEPTWPTKTGDTVTDGSTVWTCREEKIKAIGAKGFTIGATLSTDSDEWYYEAELHDSVAPERDAASYDPVGKKEHGE